MNFIDTATVLVKAGDGGKGVVSFRRERYIDRGGPDGGDGGKGGDVIFVGDRNMNTLANFRHKHQLMASHGQSGAKAKRHGKNGDDLLVKVPIGTAVHFNEKLIADITETGQQVIIAKGGDGGFGNAHFTSSTRQAPRVAEKGEPGDEMEVILELKMLADVGLVGLPNAGKSTFLSVVTNAKPEIADYPFTTIVPNLGVADVDNDSLLIADIPGLISGASTGKGLGDDFLRHIERTAVLIHLIDAYSESPEASYKIIMKELKAYKIDLSNRPQLIALSKIDGLDEDIVADQMQRIAKVAGADAKIYPISSKNHEGLTDLLRDSLVAVKDFRKTEEIVEEKKTTRVITIDDADRWTVTKKRSHYLIVGKKVEKFARRTDFDNEYGIRRLRDIFRKMGVMHELERQGITKGDKIRIGKHGPTFTY